MNRVCVCVLSGFDESNVSLHVCMCVCVCVSRSLWFVYVVRVLVRCVV